MGGSWEAPEDGDPLLELRPPATGADRHICPRWVALYAEVLHHVGRIQDGPVLALRFILLESDISVEALGRL